VVESVPSSRPLPAVKDLRARADRVNQQARLSGRPRDRFLREQRRRLAQRLLPTLAMIAVATGAAAFVDLFQEPTVSRWVTLSEGLTATALGALALATIAFRKNLVALTTIAIAAPLVVAVGWGVVIAYSGGIASPYALSVPLALAVLLMAVPLPSLAVLPIAAGGAVALAFAAPSAPPSAYVVFVLLGAGAFAIARTRKRRALLSFRRVERLSSAISRMRRVQEELVMVEKLDALRVLVGGIAHELNNALAVSLASTEQIVRVAERDPAAAVKAATRAQGGLMRIRGTIDRLRRFAMAEEQIVESADVGAMLDFALESAIGRARSGVAIDRAYDQGLGAIECHVAALAEAFYQVAKNAVESMPKGGVIRASVRREGDHVVVAVEDQGHGIPPQRLVRVFDPFYARESMDTLTGGRILPPLPGKSGLGLSAVYGIVNAMGGKVEIQSDVGKGTSVFIRLPLRQ
jgi:signal transduction histidine kinase